MVTRNKWLESDFIIVMCENERMSFPLGWTQFFKSIRIFKFFFHNLFKKMLILDQLDFEFFKLMYILEIISFLFVKQ